MKIQNNEHFILLICLLICILFTGCHKINRSEQIGNASDSQTQIHQAPVITTPEPTIEEFIFPKDDVLLSVLFPDQISKLEFQFEEMSGKYVVSIDDDDKIQQIINQLSKIEITDDYEPIFGAGGKNVSLSIYENDEISLIIKENSSYVTLDVQAGNQKKSYAFKDENLRNELVFEKMLDSLLEGYRFVLNNGMLDIEFIPLFIEGDDYVIQGEPGLYSWPSFNFDSIDFSQYILSIDGEIITELPKESGKFTLVIDNGVGLYQLNILVD